MAFQMFVALGLGALYVAAPQLSLPGIIGGFGSLILGQAYVDSLPEGTYTVSLPSTLTSLALLGVASPFVLHAATTGGLIAAVPPTLSLITDTIGASILIINGMTQLARDLDGAMIPGYGPLKLNWLGANMKDKFDSRTILRYVDPDTNQVKAVITEGDMYRLAVLGFYVQHAPQIFNALIGAGSPAVSATGYIVLKKGMETMTSLLLGQNATVERSVPIDITDYGPWQTVNLELEQPDLTPEQKEDLKLKKELIVETWLAKKQADEAATGISGGVSLVSTYLTTSMEITLLMGLSSTAIGGALDPTNPYLWLALGDLASQALRKFKHQPQTLLAMTALGGSVLALQGQTDVVSATLASMINLVPSARKGMSEVLKRLQTERSAATAAGAGVLAIGAAGGPEPPPEVPPPEEPAAAASAEPPEEPPPPPPEEPPSGEGKAPKAPEPETGTESAAGAGAEAKTEAREGAGGGATGAGAAAAGAAAAGTAAAWYTGLLSTELLLKLVALGFGFLFLGFALRNMSSTKVTVNVSQQQKQMSRTVGKKKKKTKQSVTRKRQGTETIDTQTQTQQIKRPRV